MSTVNWDLACKAAEAVFYALSVAALLWKFGARDGKIHAKLDVLLERTEKQARAGRAGSDADRRPRRPD